MKVLEVLGYIRVHIKRPVMHCPHIQRYSCHFFPGYHSAKVYRLEKSVESAQQILNLQSGVLRTVCIECMYVYICAYACECVCKREYLCVCMYVCTVSMYNVYHYTYVYVCYFCERILLAD